MKEINVKLTEREIEVLMITLCSEHMTLEEDVVRLEKNNKIGINARRIDCNRFRMKELDDLWNKLYDARKL